MRYTVAWEGPADFQAWSRARPPVMVGLMESSTYLTGQFLLAMPGIGDPRFERAVIAVCAHDSEGAIGIGLGARLEGLGFHEQPGQRDKTGHASCGEGVRQYDGMRVGAV